jgi:hypothetical protein
VTRVPSRSGGGGAGGLRGHPRDVPGQRKLPQDQGGSEDERQRSDELD